jgi:NADH:ubiquinone oxidoreductase subunit 6 (subunit J)
MSKKVAIGLGVSALLLCVMAIGIFATDWDDYTEYDTPQGVIVFPTDEDPIVEDDEVNENSLSYYIFEKYGLVLIPLALLMFGAMVGGVVIAREEIE